MFRLSPRPASILGLLGAITFACPSLAQTTSVKSSGGSSRAELNAQAQMADSLGRKDAAFLIRRRLRDGDFEVGDRIVFVFQSLVVPPSADSVLIVQAGKVLQLPEPLGVMNVTGILRSEIKDSLTARVATQFKNAVVRVSPLLRMSISGAVRRSGPDYVRPDMPLGDFIMRSGGMDPTAELRNTVIRRGEQTIWRSEDVQNALADGLTLEQLNLEPGDEVVVGTRQANNMALLLQIAIPIASALVVQLFLRRK